MIIIDMNQTLISTLMAQIGSNPNAEISEDLIRHMVLSTVLFYKKKFGAEYGTLVFAADDKNYWRKDVFPFYKASRKKNREKSGFDWKLIFDCLNKIRDEIRETFPYKVVQAPRAEADDIIATLCKYTQTMDTIYNALDDSKQPVLIISGDKDFMQLQKYDNVRQFSPMQKKFLKTDNPAMFLKEHIIRGDEGDGVPNYLSDDNTFVTEGKRQTPIRQVKLDVWLTQDPKEFCDTQDLLTKYERNQKLIDLSNVPPEVEAAILEIYKSPIQGNRTNLFSYFIKHKLKHLLEDISEF
jgi:5'-3' exonuclease